MDMQTESSKSNGPATSIGSGEVNTKAQNLRRIDVDDGYVQLVDYMGKGDLSVVNAARVSFGKQKEEFDESDARLIAYLARHKHMSPFRHMQFTFIIHTSEVVCRQLYKHQVGCAFTSGEFREAATVWNEISGRYVVFNERFHEISAFRRQHQSNKQASLPDEIIDQNEDAIMVYKQAIKASYDAYEKLLALGACKEQARMVLPVSFMNTLTWTASLEAVVNFIKLRDHEGAQWEIRKLALAIKDLLSPICPVSVKALLSD
jgi:thymidylate synthase (FAD)